jgi:hypothetical protein
MASSQLSLSHPAPHHRSLIGNFHTTLSLSEYSFGPNGKLVEFIKDWNELSMWEQLGWPLEECLTAGMRM